jgi:hypothetical protein
MYLITAKKGEKTVNLKRETEADRNAVVNSLKRQGWKVAVAVSAEGSVLQLKNAIRKIVQEVLAKRHPEPEKDTKDDESNLLNDDMSLDEKAPKGWEGTVKAMKKNHEIDNPWALANSMKKKGYKSHKK